MPGAYEAALRQPSAQRGGAARCPVPFRETAATWRRLPCQHPRWPASLTAGAPHLALPHAAATPAPAGNLLKGTGMVMSLALLLQGLD